MDKTDEEILDEFDKIEKMFPKAKFTVSIDIDKLDKKITDKNFIVIKHTYDCYCYSEFDKNPKYYSISGKNITYKFIIKKLIKNGFSLNCNHYFLEDIILIKNTDNYYELCVGS